MNSHILLFIFSIVLTLSYFFGNVIGLLGRFILWLFYYPFLPYNTGYCKVLELVDNPWPHSLFGYTYINYRFLPYYQSIWPFGFIYCNQFSWFEIFLGIFIISIVIGFLLVQHYCKNRFFNLSLFTYFASIFSTTKRHDYRNLFRNTKYFDVKSRRIDHSHPQAAQNRTNANIFINDFCLQAKLKRFDISGSKSTLAKYNGTHHWHFAKDLELDPRYDTVPVDACRTLIDVDYYLNLPSLLDGSMYVLYTFDPQRPAGNTVDGYFCSQTSDHIQLTLNGDSKYTHQLWNFALDVLIVDHWWGSSIYTVERNQVSLDRSIILLQPVRNIYTPLAWYLPGDRLTRRQFTKGKAAFMSYRHEDVRMFSIAMLDCYKSIDLSEAIVGTCKARLGSKKDAHIADVERIFRASDVDDPIVAASIFFSCWEVLPLENTKCMVRSKTHYQTLRPLVLEDGKESMREFTSTPYLPGFSANRSTNNDVATIDGRLVKVANNKQCPEYMLGYKAEFIRCISRDVVNDTCVPLSYDEYIDRLKKPNVKLKLSQEEQFLFHEPARVNSFQKAEAYGSINDPRNISQLNLPHNFKTGQYMYPATDVLKLTKWYMPGKHPRDVASRIMDIASEAKSLTDTDINRLDGSTSSFMKSVPDDLLCHLYRDYDGVAPAELVEALDSESRAKGKTQHGVKYQVGSTVCSGSSLTSFRGTTMNAFTNYCAIRNTGLDEKAAYAALGCYFGDDGLTPDLSPDVIDRTGAEFGFKFKSHTIHPGHCAMYLGRLFVDPWTTGASIADVARQLRKLHLAELSSVPFDIVLKRRAEAYLVTDPNTPFIREWSDQVIRLVNGNTAVYEASLSSKLSYWLSFEHPFIVPSYEDALPLVAANLGLSVERLTHYIGKLKSVVKLEDLFFAISTSESEVKVPAVTNGTIVSPPMEVKIITPITSVKPAEGKIEEQRDRKQKPKQNKTERKTQVERKGEPEQKGVDSDRKPQGDRRGPQQSAVKGKRKGQEPNKDVVKDTFTAPFSFTAVPVTGLPPLNSNPVDFNPLVQEYKNPSPPFVPSPIHKPTTAGNPFGVLGTLQLMLIFCLLLCCDLSSVTCRNLVVYSGKTTQNNFHLIPNSIISLDKTALNITDYVRSHIHLSNHIMSERKSENTALIVAKDALELAKKRQRQPKPKPKKNKQKKQNKQSKSNGNNNGNNARVMAKKYADALNDPFNLFAPHIGFGTFSGNSTDAVLYYSNFFVGLPDGTVATRDMTILVQPDAALNNGSFVSGVVNTLSRPVNIIYGNGSTLTTSYCYGTGYNNYATVLANTSSFRVKSCGLRVVVSAPTTDVRPYVSVTRLNGIPGAPATTLDAVTPNSLVLLPESRTYAAGIITEASIAWYPNDASDFVFGPPGQYTNGNTLVNPIAVSIIGTTVLTRIYVESVCQIETLVGIKSSTLVEELQTTNMFTLSDYFPNLETLTKFARPYIKEYGRVAIDTVLSNIGLSTVGLGAHRTTPGSGIQSLLAESKEEKTLSGCNTRLVNEESDNTRSNSIDSSHYPTIQLPRSDTTNVRDILENALDKLTFRSGSSGNGKSAH